jgi:hypothetical protein
MYPGAGEWLWLVHSPAPGYTLKGKETIGKQTYINIDIETNPVNIPWNTDR